MCAATYYGAQQRKILRRCAQHYAMNTMQHSAFNILVYAGLALLEATPAAIVMTMLGVPGALPVFVLLALLAAVAELVIEQRMRLDWQRPLRVIIALLLGIAAASILSGGLDALAQALLSFDEHSSLAYIGLLVALYVVWRGTNLTLLVDEDVRDVFGRNMLIVLGILLLGVLLGSFSAPALATFITIEVLLAFAVGLVLVALVRQHEAAPELQRIRGWHNVAPVIGATLLIIVLSLGVLGLLGANAAELLSQLILSAIMLLFTIIAPLLELILGGFIWLFERLNVPRILGLLQNLAAGLAQRTELQQQQQQNLEQQFPWLASLMHALELGLPILGMLLLIWFLSQRRRWRPALVTEERESVFSWEAFGNDLLDLLGRLRKRQEQESLETALARLQGDSPSIRIRRSYLKMLISAEQRNIARNSSSTPREYQPQVQAAFPGAGAELQTLTGGYERARYHAEAVTPEEAEGVEEAWSRMNDEG